MAHNDPVQSVTRAADILEHISRAEAGLSLTELSRATGLKAPTAHNLARSLAERGLLEKCGAPPRYCLGPKVFELAARRQRGAARERLLRIVQALAARWPQATITLTESVGDDLAVTLRMSPEQLGVVERPQDRRPPAYTSTSALVFQAFWTAEQRARYQQRYPFEEYGAGTWRSPSQLEKYLNEIRRTGRAVAALPGSRAQCEPAAFSNATVARISAPVFSPQHELIGAAGLAIPAGQLKASRVSADKLIEVVGGAAE